MKQRFRLYQVNNELTLLSPETSFFSVDLPYWHDIQRKAERYLEISSGSIVARLFEVDRQALSTAEERRKYLDSLGSPLDMKEWGQDLPFIERFQGGAFYFQK
ncbi:hypothetical protein [Caldalkalibacillus mannanilyticus]|uniref:hypothetical protein n=1 Tax=Caldalkalibacillus mannanilyticus TaxID=1418 RepID=UPI0004697FE5|nr:hypothetical protein [Caldalkalibacillus mannanilyticus]